MTTTPDEREAQLVALDDELMKGGYILSEWCIFITKDAHYAYVNGTFLAAIVMATAGIETYLRSEYGVGSRDRFVDLIDRSPLDEQLKTDLQSLRKYRNKWVHIDDPWDDTELIERPENMEDELEGMALFAMRALLSTIYENPWV